MIPLERFVISGWLFRYICVDKQMSEQEVRDYYEKRGIELHVMEAP